MLTVRTSENTVITSFRLISERQDFSSVRTVRTPFARVREFTLSPEFVPAANSSSAGKSGRLIPAHRILPEPSEK